MQYECIDTNELYLPNFILSRFYVTLYLLSYCVFHFNWCRVNIYIHIYIYMRIYLCVCVYIYICVYVPANACYHVYMIICMFSLCAHFMYADFMMFFFYLWLLGQRWPNKEVQTDNIYHIEIHRNLILFSITEDQTHWWKMIMGAKETDVYLYLVKSRFLQHTIDLIFIFSEICGTDPQSRAVPLLVIGRAQPSGAGSDICVTRWELQYMSGSLHGIRRFPLLYRGTYHPHSLDELWVGKTKWLSCYIRNFQLHFLHGKQLCVLSKFHWF